MPQHFIRCQACGLPHPSDADRCPVHGTPLVRTPSGSPPPLEGRRGDLPSAAPIPRDSAWPPEPRESQFPAAYEPDQPRPTREAPLVGQLLHGRYRVCDVIAKGGMGMVYDGIHVGLVRPVAIKTLHPRLAGDPVALARFHNEATVAGRFGHPNIVDVYDMGVLDDGSPYLVMERLEGETLTHRLRRERPMPIPTAADITAQVLSALTVTHAQGILHRDLKPDNLFLVGSERSPRVKVLDFGVSAMMAEGALHGADVLGVVAGTPAFMAPEQALALPDADGRVDLYSLGMVLYVMLTSRLPYKAMTPAALLVEMQRATPMRPRMLRPEVPPSLDAFTMRALAASRDERFESAQAMLHALEDLPLDDLRAPAPPPSIRGAGESDSQKVEYFVRESVLPPPPGVPADDDGDDSEQVEVFVRESVLPPPFRES